MRPRCAEHVPDAQRPRTEVIGDEGNAVPIPCDHVHDRLNARGRRHVTDLPGMHRDLLAISDTTEEAIRSRDLATNIAMVAGRLRWPLAEAVRPQRTLFTGTETHFRHIMKHAPEAMLPDGLQS